jgi:hypothetical protein
MEYHLQKKRERGPNQSQNDVNQKIGKPCLFFDSQECMKEYHSKKKNL